MTSLEDLTVGALVRRILDRPIRVFQAEWHAAETLTLQPTPTSPADQSRSCKHPDYSRWSEEAAVAQVAWQIVDGRIRYAGLTLAQWVPKVVADLVAMADPLARGALRVGRPWG
jgi:hypothetical protein